MRIASTAVLVWMALASAAHAQSADASKGYAEGVAQSAFGNVTSQSYGAEIGVTVRPGIQVFVDAGVIRDTAPAALGAGALKIAGGIAAVAGDAAASVRQPVTFGVAGLKYVVPSASARIAPYVLVGFGVANVEKDVTFTSSAGDVSRFATIGSDLSGSETKGMLSAGGGIMVPVWRTVIIDLQYRYGHVFTSEGINVNRAGIGAGVRF